MTKAEPGIAIEEQASEEQAAVQAIAPGPAARRACTTCGKAIEAEDGWVASPGPGCHKQAITRCASCKVLENTYTCSQCKFEGP